MGKELSLGASPNFPSFRYYEPGRNPPGEARWRIAHRHVLDAAVLLLRAPSPGEKARWAAAMDMSWRQWLPDYMFTAPASATGKYHPAWANRPDGLLLHGLAVCRVAASLSDLFDIKDAAYNALIFAAWHHDMFKYGDIVNYRDGDMTVHEHPVLAADFFLLPHVISALGGLGISPAECAGVADMIATHAGPYRSSKFSDYRLPECAGMLNRLLYKSDYIASRREDGWIYDQLQEIPMPGQ